MRINSLKTLDLILSLSKDEAKLSGFFSSLLKVTTQAPQPHVIDPDTVPDQLDAVLMHIAFRISPACRARLSLFCNSSSLPGLAQPRGSVYRWLQA